jgi:Sulfotransferase domain
VLAWAARMVLRISLWSGPRSVSTALMYAFAQRPDTAVVDEPLYAFYLARTGAPHQGREEVLAAQDADAERVVREVLLGPCERPVVFFKQMAHHLEGLERGFLARLANVLLVRDPLEMLPSLAVQLPDARLADTGLALQARLLDELRAMGQDPPVLDTRELLLDPAGVLGELCLRLGLEFDARMLRWSPGPRPEDGVWARHWYDGVHRSSGFGPYRRKRAPFPERLRPLYETCRPHYETLRAVAIRARAPGPGARGA